MRRIDRATLDQCRDRRHRHARAVARWALIAATVVRTIAACHFAGTGRRLVGIGNACRRARHAVQDDRHGEQETQQRGDDPGAHP
ncbi:MAG TPA: hypothetical protein VND91_02525 [Candidatus Saccharimonadia bacterium]|nr:hypothetical protein [Candidatus Saccharimonadia bacterium]